MAFISTSVKLLGMQRLQGENPDSAVAGFEPLRPTLVRVAYRMLGSVTDAEDVVQEAFLRWLAADRTEIREPQAFLRRVVTRLCLDQLKSARRRRETYLGPWLPEPIVEPVDEDSVQDITLPLMLALERLSPLERAAFLLHDIFGENYASIARTIGREEAACRQLARRARANIRSARPRFPLPRERGLELAAAFFAASRSGDMQQLGLLLADDVAVHADGGGNAAIVSLPATGIDQVLRLHKTLHRIFARAMSRLERYAIINGLPGFITTEQGGVLQTTALHIEAGKIVGIYVVRNPDKLCHLRATAH